MVRQFFTAREKLVPIRHIFHTNISHFVKFTHVVKLYVAYMRNLHIDTIPSKSAAFCIRFDSNSSHIWQDFITCSNRLQINFICFTVEKSKTGVRLQINYISRVARKCFFGVHAPDSPACRLNIFYCQI